MAEQFQGWTPYNYTLQNPVNLTDPTGMAPEDWIKNKLTGEYIWDNKITSQLNTPQGFSYIGKGDQSISRDLFGGTRFSSKTMDIGTIDFQDFDNPYSAKGVVAMYMKADTQMVINLLSDVTTNTDANGVTSKSFKGVDINVTISGKIIAPYSDMSIKLFDREMSMQGNPMNSNISSQPSFIQGGDVPTLTYKPSWSAKSIQNNFGKSYNINFDFKGQYANGVRSMTMSGVVGALGIPNTTNINTYIKFNNK